MKNLTISPSPHIHSGANTANIMFMVIVALMPAVFLSIYFFGIPALILYLVCISACMVFESAFNRLIGRADTLRDGSAMLTGILLAMNLPSALPLWIAVAGSFVSIVVAKMVFGGLGGNPFNPALVGRVFLLVSFPAQMTNFTLPKGVDGVSSATILSSAKMYTQAGDGLLTGFELPSLIPLLIGNISGSMGETSALALLLGGIVLIVMRVITWHIPAAFIGTVFVLSFGHVMVHPNTILPPLYQIFGGGLMLGAFFMATDYVTSPISPLSKLIFGVGCGVITVMIRIFGGYPEGVAFAILIMNAVTPLLDRYIRPKAYGERK